MTTSPQESAKDRERDPAPESSQLVGAVAVLLRRAERADSGVVSA
ncbi:hypothetical protein QMA61_02410 [Streptomyces coelicoflavus]|nr:hypothetical protein [Streptomyces coelicoflavus]MDI6515041.1 hypothetical protein [Streptomyces coelicoflavus]